MTSKEKVLNRERDRGKNDALSLAIRAQGMTGTAIIAEQDHIPAWSEDAVYTMAEIGYPVQDNGQVYTIIQPHTPAHNPGFRPADLPSIYSIKHTTDPKRAKPYMPPNGTSGMYMKDDCAVENGCVYRSKYDNNAWTPSGYAEGWEYLGTIEEVQG